MFSDHALGWIMGLSYWKWLVTGLALLGIEVFTGTTYLLWAGLAALLTGIVTLGFAPLDWRIQVALFAVFAFLLVIAGRRVVRPFWTPASDDR